MHYTRYMRIYIFIYVYINIIYIILSHCHIVYRLYHNFRDFYNEKEKKSYWFLVC